MGTNMRPKRYIVRPSVRAFWYVLWDKRECKSIAESNDLRQLAIAEAKLNDASPLT
jgi:hypothetical protein